MCGRFLIDYEFRDIMEKYQLTKYRGSFRSGEIFPSQQVMVVTDQYAISMQWGFKFPWSKRLVINSKSETVHEKKSFKNIIQRNRCIIPISAYYEWSGKKDQKDKYEIQYEKYKITSVAGIYRILTDDTGKQNFEFSILTKAADPSIEKIHHRMPVILKKHQVKHWLMKRPYEMDTMSKLFFEEPLQLSGKIV